MTEKPNNAINSDHKKRRFALLFVAGYGWRYAQKDVALRVNVVT